MRATGVFAQPEGAAGAEASSQPASPSLLDRRWELDPASKLGTFNLRSYRPVYVLPFFATRYVGLSVALTTVPSGRVSLLFPLLPGSARNVSVS